MELLRIQSEYARVKAARLEQIYMRAQRMEEIGRLDKAIKVQEEKEQELAIKEKELLANKQ